MKIGKFFKREPELEILIYESGAGFYSTIVDISTGKVLYVSATPFVDTREEEEEKAQAVAELTAKIELR